MLPTSVNVQPGCLLIDSSAEPRRCIRTPPFHAAVALLDDEQLNWLAEIAFSITPHSRV